MTELLVVAGDGPSDSAAQLGEIEEEEIEVEDEREILLASAGTIQRWLRIRCASELFRLWDIMMRPDSGRLCAAADQTILRNAGCVRWGRPGEFFVSFCLAEYIQ
jgi:hypothetical protein